MVSGMLNRVLHHERLRKTYRRRRSLEIGCDACVYFYARKYCYYTILIFFFFTSSFLKPVPCIKYWTVLCPFLLTVKYSHVLKKAKKKQQIIYCSFFFFYVSSLWTRVRVRYLYILTAADVMMHPVSIYWSRIYFLLFLKGFR